MALLAVGVGLGALIAILSVWVGAWITLRVRSHEPLTPQPMTNAHYTDEEAVTAFIDAQQEDHR